MRIHEARCCLPPCLALQEELRGGEDIARCPSCSLYITVIYDPVSSQNHQHGLAKLTRVQLLRALYSCASLSCRKLDFSVCCVQDDFEDAEPPSPPKPAEEPAPPPSAEVPVTKAVEVS